MSGEQARPAALLGAVAIVGTGLIGTSIGLGLRSRFIAREVHGLDADPAAAARARELGALDHAHPALGSWLSACDLVIIAVPMLQVAGSLAALHPHLAPGAVVTDAGSVKAEAVRLGEALYGERYVGGHPMAGSERSGPEGAYAGLLQNAIWVLTPTAATGVAALDLVRRVVGALGAEPLELEPRQHDRLVATVSHLPYLVAVALTRIVANDADRDSLTALAAGGFRDLTRVASGSPVMSRDMVSANQDEVRAALERFRRELAAVEETLDQPQDLLGAAHDAKRVRDALPVVRRSLVAAPFDLVVAVPDRPGQLARITGALGEAGVNIKEIEVLAIREEGGAVRVGFATADERTRARDALTAAGIEVR